MKTSFVFIVFLLASMLTSPAFVLADLSDDPDDVETPKTGEGKTPETPKPKGGGPTVPPKDGSSETPPTPRTPHKDEDDTDSTRKRPGKSSGPKTSSREPIYFESQGMQGLRNQGTIHLKENVIVTQGDLRMEADKATIFYDQRGNEVSKVVANGNVRIFKTDPETGLKIRAESNEVLFYNDDRKVVLKGNARLWRGTDLVRGKQITYELDSGWVRADRVEGVVQPREDQPRNGASQSKR